MSWGWPCAWGHWHPGGWGAASASASLCSAPPQPASSASCPTALAHAACFLVGPSPAVQGPPATFPAVASVTLPWPLTGQEARGTGGVTSQGPAWAPRPPAPGDPAASGDWAQGLGCRMVGHRVVQGEQGGAVGRMGLVLPVAPWDPQGGPSRAPPLCVLLAQMRPRCSSQPIHQIIPVPGCWDKPPRCVLSQPGARMSRVRACRAAGEAPGLQMAPRPARPLLVKTLLLRAVLGSEQIGVAGGETSRCPPCPTPHPPQTPWPPTSVPAGVGQARLPCRPRPEPTPYVGVTLAAAHSAGLDEHVTLVSLRPGLHAEAVRRQDGPCHALLAAPGAPGPPC